MFTLRNGFVFFSSDVGGSHVTMFAPGGAKLLFRGDQSSGWPGAGGAGVPGYKYTWAFEQGAQFANGQYLVFATHDREVVAEITMVMDETGTRHVAKISNAKVTVTRGEGGKPMSISGVRPASVPKPKPEKLITLARHLPGQAPPKEMRVLMINPSVPYNQWGCGGKVGAMNEASFSAHGMAYVSATLKNAGHEVWLVDLRNCTGWQHTSDMLAAQEFDVAFVGFLSIDCFNAAAVVRLMKELHPNKPLVVGGLHVSIAKEGVFPREDLMDEYLFGNQDNLPDVFKEFLRWKGEAKYEARHFPQADYVILDDGEIAARDLVAELAAGRTPANRTIEGGAVPMEVARHVDRDLFDLSVEAYSPILPFQPTPMATTTWARGCPFRCTYSLAGDTLIFTDDGPVKIADLAAGVGAGAACPHGGEVLEHGLDRRVATMRGWQKATRALNEGLVHHPLLRVSAGGFEVTTTINQKFYAPPTAERGAWVEAKDLRRGDVLWARRPLDKVGREWFDSHVRDAEQVDNDLFIVRVTSVEDAGITSPVYDLVVPGVEHFVANGLVVHNCNLSSQLSNTNVRTKPGEMIIEELDDLHRRLGRLGSLMIHDDLTFHHKAIEEWCESILKKYPEGVPIWMQSRAGIIIKWHRQWPEFWKLLCRTGLTWVSVGYECLDGDTQILMDSGEARPIRDATGNAVAVSDGQVVKADSVLIDQGKVLDMVHIETSTHEIVASLDHRFFKFDDGTLTEVRAGDLVIGDWVAVCRRAPQLGSRTMSEAQAEIAGFFLGDGTLTESVNGKTRFRLSQKNKQMLEHYAKQIDVAFGLSVSVNSPPSRAIHTLETAAPAINTWAQSLRRPGRDGYDEIPDIIAKGDDSIIAAFLRGYFDAEGHVELAEKKVNVVCKNERPMVQIKSLLMRLGIASGKVIREDYTNAFGSFTQYSVWIRQAAAVRRFADLVGFNHPERASSLHALLDVLAPATRKGDYLPFSVNFLRRLLRAFSPGKGVRGAVSMRQLRKTLHRVVYGKKRDEHGTRRCDLIPVVALLRDAKTTPELEMIKKWLATEDLGFERVKALTPAGRRRAYDLHVPRYNNYIANGFLVHNSGSQRMLDYMKKDSTVEENLECGRILDEYGINSFGNFLWGVPTETEEDAEATVSLVQQIKPGFLSGSIYCSYPGTAQDRMCREQGLIVPGEVYTRSHLPWQFTIKGIDYAHRNDCVRRAGQYANYLRMPKLLSPERQAELAASSRGLAIHTTGGG